MKSSLRFVFPALFQRSVLLVAFVSAPAAWAHTWRLAGPPEFETSSMGIAGLLPGGSYSYNDGEGGITTTLNARSTGSAEFTTVQPRYGTHRMVFNWDAPPEYIQSGQVLPLAVRWTFKQQWNRFCPSMGSLAHLDWSTDWYTSQGYGELAKPGQGARTGEEVNQTIQVTGDGQQALTFYVHVHCGGGFVRLRWLYRLVEAGAVPPSLQVAAPTSPLATPQPAPQPAAQTPADAPAQTPVQSLVASLQAMERILTGEGGANAPAPSPQVEPQPVDIAAPVNLPPPPASVRVTEARTAAAPPTNPVRAGGRAPVENLALRQKARQSSTGYGGDPQRAVDGDTNGNYQGNSVSHTKEEAEAWWEVDLGRVQEIGEIRLWNRTDEHGDRLVNFHVLISERPFASNRLGAARQTPGIWQRSHPGTAGVTTVIQARTTGRYVRVQLQQTNFLALAEVEVMGVAAGESAAPAAPPTIVRASPEEILFKLESVAAVQNNPTRKTLFAADNPATITKIWTYHWNDGRGAAPGTIGLRNVDTDEMFGPWPVVALNQHFDSGVGAVWPAAGDGPPHRYWTVRPNVSVPAGTYEVVDSDRATWSTNSEMKNMGAAWVYGRTESGLAASQRAAGGRTPRVNLAAPNQAGAIDAAKLAADLGRFRTRAAIEPADAWRNFSTEGAFPRLPEVQKTFFGAIPPEVGWSYFFHAALYVVCPYTNEVAVAFFYHPWSDTGLITLWQQINGRSLLLRADVVPGDLLRNPAARKIDLPPAWLRQVDQLPPMLTLPMVAGETLRAFAAMFPVVAAQQKTPVRNATRDQLEAALENASWMKTCGAVASARLVKGLEGLQRYAEDRNLTRCRETAERVHVQLARGDFSALAGSATETQPETLALLLRLQPQLAGYSVVAFAAAPQACQVFLSHPAEPKHVLTLWLETPPDRVGLRRVDFISHDLGVLLGDKLRSLVDTAMATDATAANRKE